MPRIPSTSEVQRVRRRPLPGPKCFHRPVRGVRNMLKDPQVSPVYLAVDALDECAQGRSDLIHLISTSLSLSQRVRWLLSSRPEVDLLAGLKDPGTSSADASKSPVELDTQR